MTTISFLSEDQNENPYPLLQKIIKYNKSRNRLTTYNKIFDKFITDPNLNYFSNDSLKTDNNIENKTISLPKYRNIKNEINNFEKKFNNYFVPFNAMSVKYGSFIYLKFKDLLQNRFPDNKRIEINKNRTLKDFYSKSSFKEKKIINIFKKYNKNNTNKNNLRQKDYIKLNKIKLRKFAKLPKGIEKAIFNKKNINKINNDKNNIRILFNKYYNNYKKFENKKRENKNSFDKINANNIKFSPDKKSTYSSKTIIVNINKNKSEKKEKGNRKFVKYNNYFKHRSFFQYKNRNNNFAGFTSKIDESRKTLPGIYLTQTDFNFRNVRDQILTSQIDK